MNEAAYEVMGVVDSKPTYLKRLRFKSCWIKVLNNCDPFVISTQKTLSETDKDTSEADVL